MPTNSAFVSPFPSSWTWRGAANIVRKRIPDTRQQNRKICLQKKASSSRTTVISSLLSRQLLLRRKKGSQAEEVEEEATKSHDKNIVALRRTGMNTPMVLSKEMQEFVGHDMLSRSQLVTHISKYIDEKGLNVKENRSRFVVDQFLSRLLGAHGDYSILDLQKLVSKHLTKPREMGPEYEERSNRIFANYLKERGAVDSKFASRRKDPRGLNSRKRQQELRKQGMGMYADVVLDPCLRTLCGGRDRMSRPQLLKAVWTYIKDKNLQDPKNRRHIIVDDELRKALKITDAVTIDCFHVGRYLWKLCNDPRAK